MNKIFSICDKILQYCFYLLFFLVPLILTPFNFELFEFNKMMLVYFLTATIVAVWLIKMVVSKKLILRRTFLDTPLLIFFISQFASSLFSIDRHTSFWGYYSRFHGGLASTISYLLLYYAFVSFAKIRMNPNINSPNKSEYSEKKFGLFPIWKDSDDPRQFVINCLGVSLLSGFLVASYGILEHFGIDKDYWVQDVQNRVFSTLGQPNWLAAYLVALVPLAWGLAQKNRKTEKQKNRKAFLVSWFLSFLVAALFYLTLLYTKSRSGLLGFAVAYTVFWGLAFLKIRLTQKNAYAKNCVKNFLAASLVIGLITLFVGTPWTPNLGQVLQKRPSPEIVKEKPPIPVGGTESGEIRKIVWKGAIAVWKHYPIFGSGVETFAYSYYNFRPREHNDVSEWDFLYNKAHNEYLNFLATTGIFGLGSYLLLIGAFIFWNLKQIFNFKFLISKQIPNPNDSMSKKLGQLGIRSIRNLEIALLAGYTSILVTNFFGFSVVPVALLFFLYPAMSVVLSTSSRSANRKPLPEWTRSYTLGIGQWLAFGAILLITIYCLLSVLRFWYADTLFAKGGKLNDAGQYDQAFNKLKVAVKLNPGEPFYHDELSQSAASLAVLAFKQNQATLSAQLTELAISESDQALKITPRHLNFWKNRTRVFYTLSEIDEKYNQNALESLLTASELAPTDAKIFYNLGLMYARLGQDETAIKTLEKTVQLKPNYETARYALALFYEQKKDLELAKNELKYILERINPKNETVKKKLEELQ